MRRNDASATPLQTAKLKFWGVRGSTPTVDRVTQRYGGNTSCLELVSPAGNRFILDCGSGLRMLSNRWTAGPAQNGADTHIFVTHYHWDHIQGIPFFAPLYSPENKFHFYSFRSDFLGRDSLKRVFEAQMALPYFPVDLSAMSAARDFTELAGGDKVTVGDTTITACWLNHPQGCLGFRLDTPAGAIVYTTDNEPGRREFDATLLELCAGADVLVNDAQFTPEQLAGIRKGWGHSSWLEGVKLAKAAGVRHLVLFHHDPDSSDKMVDDILRKAQGQFDNAYAAAEGMVLTLDAGALDVSLPVSRELVRRPTHFPALVSGCSPDGRSFEEETIVRDLSLQGALIYLDHAPRLQSTLLLTINDLGAAGANKNLVLRGHVVRLEPAPDGQVGVGILFTE
jgi:phosphoribosyl 1,2-cyclic phosphodiesterase